MVRYRSKHKDSVFCALFFCALPTSSARSCNDNPFKRRDVKQKLANNQDKSWSEQFIPPSICWRLLLRKTLLSFRPYPPRTCRRRFDNAAILVVQSSNNTSTDRKQSRVKGDRRLSPHWHHDQTKNPHRVSASWMLSRRSANPNIQQATHTFPKGKVAKHIASHLDTPKLATSRLGPHPPPTQHRTASPG